MCDGTELDESRGANAEVSKELLAIILNNSSVMLEIVVRVEARTEDISTKFSDVWRFHELLQSLGEAWTKNKVSIG